MPLTQAPPTEHQAARRPAPAAPPGDGDQPDRGDSLLAWAGWRLEMPADWRPLKLSGMPDKGSMIVGDAMCAIFSIHWERPRRRRTIGDGKAWGEQRLRRQGLHPDPAPPAARHFTACTWARGVQSEEQKQTTYWYGFAEPAGLVLGVKVNGVLPEPMRDEVIRRVLPSLRASATDQPSTWAMHDVSFVVPGGFTLEHRHLFTGDVALAFRKGRKDRLLVRQVYPGDLALGRRTPERWLRAYPCPHHRRLRPGRDDPEPWRRTGGNTAAASTVL